MTPNSHDPLGLPEYDRGLQYDLSTLINRRQALRALAGTSLVALISCGRRGAVTTLLTTTTTTAVAVDATTSAPGTGAGVGTECEVIPEETAGPFPGDGTVGPNVLDLEGVVRRDLTTSFGGLTGSAAGVPLTIQLNVQQLADGCAPYAGAAVYVWQCDASGLYSLYSNGALEVNYLRGVQTADDNGLVTFTSIFPACYPGRWPHVHFEVYPDLDAALDVANKVATSQIAFPAEVCAEVYATAGYESSVESFPQVSLLGDGVFGEDGGERQLGTLEGTVAEGLTVTLAVPV